MTNAATIRACIAARATNTNTKVLVLKNILSGHYSRKALNQAVAQASGLNIRRAARAIRHGAQIGDRYLLKVEGYGYSQWYVS